MDPDTLPLRDLHLPDAVGWWPLAPGWWFLLLLLVAGLGWLLVRARRKWRFNAARRYGMRELAALESSYLQHRNPVRLSQQLSALLRRVMLAYASRKEVAGLTGERWLQWLDRDLPVPYFHTQGGNSLVELPYRDPEGDFADVDVSALLAAVRMRLATPIDGAR